MHAPFPLQSDIFMSRKIITENSKAMGEIDSAFIQESENRPKPTIFIESQEIPLIDLSISTSRTKEKIVFEIKNACEKWGFFQVINHGVPLNVCRKLETAVKEFFGQSMEEKRTVKRDEMNSMGYYESEHTKNVKDWKEIFDFPVEDTVVIPASPEADDDEIHLLTNQWPEYPFNFRNACKEYAKEVEKLAYKLSKLISLSLGLHEKRLNGYFKEQTSIVRLNHYPPCPCPDLALGVGRHKDAAVLTLLAQDDVGGLEVFSNSHSQWIHVNPIPHSFVINVGDIIQVWSNDKYGTVEHRVRVNSTKERFSIPFFFLPSHHTIVKPLEELINPNNPSKYKPYNCGKFLAARIRSD